MNKLFCFLTGGHRYLDKNIISCPSDKKFHYTMLRNECVKCGKPIEVEVDVGAIVRAEMERLRKEKKTRNDQT